MLVWIKLQNVLTCRTGSTRSLPCSCLLAHHSFTVRAVHHFIRHINIRIFANFTTKRSWFLIVCCKLQTNLLKDKSWKSVGWLGLLFRSQFGLGKLRDKSLHGRGPCIRFAHFMWLLWLQGFFQLAFFYHAEVFCRRLSEPAAVCTLMNVCTNNLWLILMFISPLI